MQVSLSWAQKVERQHHLCMQGLDEQVMVDACLARVPRGMGNARPFTDADKHALEVCMLFFLPALLTLHPEGKCPPCTAEVETLLAQLFAAACMDMTSRVCAPAQAHEGICRQALCAGGLGNLPCCLTQQCWEQHGQG